MTTFLTIAEVLALHADLIQRYGGSHGVRSTELLEAAVFPPQSGNYSDTIAEAAALWHSLSQNHPFIDGNKRVAFASMYSFLVVNGYELVPDADETWDFLSLAYAEHRLTFETLESWLRAAARLR